MVEKKEIDIELEEIRRESKPKKYEIQIDYPYNDLSDRAFELLVYSIFSSDSSNWRNKFDYYKCFLMNGVGEKGRDIIITKNEIIIGLIQCKKYKKNLDLTTVLKEIIKFVLFSLVDENLLPEITNFSYVLSVSTGLSNDATTYIANFNERILKDESLKNLTIGIIKDYKSFKFNYEEINEKLFNTLSKLKIEIITPIDLTVELKQHLPVITTFFKTESTINSESFEELINGRNLDVNTFLGHYRRGLLNNYSRINFFGLDIPNRPREVNLYDLFVEPQLNKKKSLDVLRNLTAYFSEAKSKINNIRFDYTGIELFTKQVYLPVVTKNNAHTNMGVKELFNIEDYVGAKTQNYLSFKD